MTNSENVDSVDQNPTPGQGRAHAESFRQRVLIAVMITVIVVAVLLIAAQAINVLLLAFASILVAIPIRAAGYGLSKRTPLTINTALIMIVLLLLVLISGALGWLIPRIAGELDQLGSGLTSILRRIEQALNQYGWGKQLLSQAPSAQQLLTNGGDILAGITGVFSNALAILTNATVVLFAGIYLAFQPGLYVNGILQLVPKHRQARAREVIDVLHFRLQRWLLARLVSMVENGVTAGLGLFLLGMPFVLPLAIFTGLMGFIPAIGPIIGAIPATLVALAQGPQQTLNVILLYVIVQFIDNYLVAPIVEQKAVYLPPALTVFMQLLLGVFAGFLGIALAAPLTVVLGILVKMLYVEDMLSNRTSLAVRQT